MPLICTTRYRICSMLAALLVAGCAATAQISLDPQLLPRLRDMGEIRGVHYFTPWGGAMRIVSSRNVTWSYDDEFLPVEAPVKSVKDRFLARISQELQLTNVQVLDQPHGVAKIGPLMAPPIELLKEEFIRGLVFDFYTGIWELDRVPELLPSGTPRYRFGTYVRARLIRLDDATILWQQFCLPADLKPEQRALNEWLANDFALLRAEVERQVQYCADDLVARFLGKGGPG